MMLRRYIRDAFDCQIFRQIRAAAADFTNSALLRQHLHCTRVSRFALHALMPTHLLHALGTTLPRIDFD